jgi:hypothetical protein
MGLVEINAIGSGKHSAQGRGRATAGVVLGGLVLAFNVLAALALFSGSR